MKSDLTPRRSVVYADDMLVIICLWAEHRCGKPYLDERKDGVIDRAFDLCTGYTQVRDRVQTGFAQAT